VKNFRDRHGRVWVASAREEDTPRHHGRWFLVLHPDGAEDELLAMPEVRWQTRATAERTLLTMSDFELRRRLAMVRGRAASPGPPAVSAAAAPRDRTSASKG
jgi:hypothetical protein